MIRHRHRHADVGKKFVVVLALALLVALSWALTAQRADAGKAERYKGKTAEQWYNRAVARRHQANYLQLLLVKKVHQVGRLERLLTRGDGNLTTDLERNFLCIYSHENGGYGWSANTGNGYYGGLQMDRGFQSTYGPEFYKRWGTADQWPASVQIAVSIRAYFTRGYWPWPNTARMCGLL